MSKSAAESNVSLEEGPLNVYKYRWVYLGLSLLFLIPGIVFIVMNMMNPEIQAPVRLGIDFRGGTLLEYGFSKPIKQDDVPAIREVLEKHGYTGSVIQIQEPHASIQKKPAEAEAPAGKESAKPVEASGEGAVEDGEAADKHVASVVSIRTKHMEGLDDQEVMKDLASKYGAVTLLQKNSIGPSMASELLTNGLLALVLAYVLIVGYLTMRFQFDYAVCAMLALAHDTLFLIGVYAIFGHFFHTEIDSLFITALLTVVGFSVHDTIVVFDRIRENSRVYFTKKIPFRTLVNMSVNQTLTRSINTSLTVLLTMLALYLWGGETTKDFVLAIIIGLIAGTYSSIFNASVMLAMWRERTQPQGQAATA